MESEKGLAFLHRIHVALHAAFSLKASCSLDDLALFLKLSTLDKYLAASPSAQQRFSAQAETVVLEHATDEKERLGLTMPPRKIALVEDETFHQRMICLVAIEPVSNFIVLEQYADARDAKTWDDAVETALSGLNVEIEQVTADCASGIKKHVEESLGVPLNADLFHVQHDVSSGTAAPLGAKLRRAEEAVEKQDDTYNRGALEEAKTNYEEMKAANRALGEEYHPFNLQSGARQSATRIKTKLKTQFAKMHKIAKRAKLSITSKAKLRKAERVLPSLIATIAFVHQTIALLVAGLDVCKGLKDLLHKSIIPGLYLQRAAAKAKTAELREVIVEKAMALLAIKEGSIAWLTASDETRKAVLEAGKRCAELFQRSSSCVEGRNGQLSLRHHHLHKIRPRKLGVLTALHNYFIKRADGTTAAERFFGSKPRDLFEVLCEKLPFPARPRTRRSAVG